VHLPDVKGCVSSKAFMIKRASDFGLSGGGLSCNCPKGRCNVLHPWAIPRIGSGINRQLLAICQNLAARLSSGEASR
jgi:hypothetical protein